MYWFILCLVSMVAAYLFYLKAETSHLNDKIRLYGNASFLSLLQAVFLVFGIVTLGGSREVISSFLEVCLFTAMSAIFFVLCRLQIRHTRRLIGKNLPFETLESL